MSGVGIPTEGNDRSADAEAETMDALIVAVMLYE